MNLLSDNGYKDSIVFLNGSNNDEISKRIYAEWKERHKNDGTISGSRQADMKAAVVENSGIGPASLSVQKLPQRASTCNFAV